MPSCLSPRNPHHLAIPRGLGESKISLMPGSRGEHALTEAVAVEFGPRQFNDNRTRRHLHHCRPVSVFCSHYLFCSFLPQICAKSQKLRLMLGDRGIFAACMMRGTTSKGQQIHTPNTRQVLLQTRPGICAPGSTCDDARSSQ